MFATTLLTLILSLVPNLKISRKNNRRFLASCPTKCILEVGAASLNISETNFPRAARSKSEWLQATSISTPGKLLISWWYRSYNYIRRLSAEKCKIGKSWNKFRFMRQDHMANLRIYWFTLYWAVLSGKASSCRMVGSIASEIELPSM